MTLDRATIEPGIVDELNEFRALLDTLDEAAWRTPTRCAGWSVGDVAGHVVGSMADVVSGRLDGLGSPEVTAREVDERRGRSPADLAGELADVTGQAKQLLTAFDDAAWAAPAPGGYAGTLAQGIEALWYDTWAHGDDIRAAVG